MSDERQDTNPQSVYDRSIEGWHLDKRVPVALIVTIFLAVVAGVYAYAMLEGTVLDHEARITRLEEHDRLADQSRGAVLNKVTQLDATLVAELAAIKVTLDVMRIDLRELRKWPGTGGP